MIRDIALRYGDDPVLRSRLRDYQRHALDAIASCGTVAAGVHREVCDSCGDARLVPNTCGHRSCPHCQGRTRLEWVAAREAELIGCEYYHAIFTLPAQLRLLALVYPAAVYGALMRAAADAIAHLCRAPRFLGGEVGQLAVLHTWKRDLGCHPHVHLIVTAGGWDADRGRWIPSRRYGKEKQAFLLPIKVLRKAFKFRLRRLLITAYGKGAFAAPPARLAPILSSEFALRRYLDGLMKRPWVIRIQRPFAGPKTLLRYLGNYVNRVACSPRRVIAHDEASGTLTYTWRTNAAPALERRATIPATDFLRRFLQHVLPPGFHRIRFRGLWSTAHRATKLRVVQRHFGIDPPPEPEPIGEGEPTPCPICGQGHYRRASGPCPRPGAHDRRRCLTQIRAGRRPAVPETERRRRPTTSPPPQRKPSVGGRVMPTEDRRGA